MTKNLLITWSLLTIATTLIAIHAVQRDIRYDEEYTTDLRNRVVGARLLKDGRDPYFYKWHPVDGLRYYDPSNCNTATFSRVTVSPFFLQLLAPVADWPEATISRFWLVLEYLILLLITSICLSIARNMPQKQTVIAFAALFLLTNGWKEHTSNGQMYLFVPLLAALFYICARRTTGSVWGGLAGLLAAILVLVRINSVFFFLPFLLLLPRYDRRWLFAACIAPLVLGAGTLLNSRERRLWSDYLRSTSEQIKYHQGMLSFNKDSSWQHDPGYAYWEGFDMQRAKKMMAIEPDEPRCEDGNVFVIYYLIFRQRLPLWALSMICLTGIGIVLLFFSLRNRPFGRISLEQAMLLGYTLYMFSDLCSPVYRAQYPSTQWAFPLLLAAGRINTRQKIFYYLLLAGLLLNCFHLSFLKMQNTIGEYLFLVVLFLMAADPDPVNEKISS